MALSRNGLTRSIKRNSGSYWRPSPSRVMSALNARFNSEINLALERSAQLADDLDWPVPTDFGYLAFDHMRKVVEDSEISVDLCLDSGTPNFQDHWRAT